MGFVAFAAALAAGVYSLAAEPESMHPLFYIAKNDSREEVHYAMALRPDCRFSDNPVHAYWLRRADPSAPPRPLTWLQETLVYGIRISNLEERRVVFTLAADNTRAIVVESSPANGRCGVRARVRMLGQWVVPKRVHVEIADGRPLIPDVSYVELHATGNDGTAVCEKMVALRTPGTPCTSAK